MATIEFNFSIEDRIVFNAKPDKKGNVAGLFIGRSGNKLILVEYIDNTGGLNFEYFPQEELSLAA